ncbi:MAG: alpha-amylase/4-alpha-glucanotransferase domain-containing protein [Planctomycetaceae bacterium]
MTPAVRLVLCIHNHQPIGNFDGVCEDAYRDSYAPFLGVLEDYPEIPFALHTSGSLLEWLADNHPEYIERVRALVERGQVEIVGGAFYEPILAGIPRRDRIGQITAYTRHLEQTFGSRIRGMWVPERVWEQSFASDIAEAGIEYTLLDDFHFKAAGLTDEQLSGYYLTEDEGRLLKVLPGSERLRYTIPFADPQETIDHLRSVIERNPQAVVTFGDDGEKLGTWPETKKHVYEEGWLRRFLDTLQHNAEWVKVVTPAEAVDRVPPLGSIYLPDCSYREMTEWALPTTRQAEYRHLEGWKKQDPDWPKIRSFMRGGFWRNFRVKYPEANEMYARMMEVSERLQRLQSEADDASRAILNRARTELYRAQCNCSYWHGAFGGLYLPHLRNAVYRNLIAADTLLETASGREGRWVEVTAGDYNLDAMSEIRLAGERLVAYFSPACGGHLYEFDVRQTKTNLLATLNRRPEPYHETVRTAAATQARHPDNAAPASIHDRLHFKQPDLDKKLIEDRWPRKSLVDHFLQPGLSMEAFRAGEGTISDFAIGVYSTRLRRSDDRAELRMERESRIAPYTVKVCKTIALEVRRSGTLEITYELENLPADMPLHFGVEFNFAAMAADESDRYFYGVDGRQLGSLQTIQSLEPTTRLGLIDEWLGLDAAVETTRPAQFWTFPIETISQSEGGFEAVHQSCVVMPHWEFTASDDGRWTTTLQLSVDTSAAQARELRETAAAR